MRTRPTETVIKSAHTILIENLARRIAQLDDMAAANLRQAGHNPDAALYLRGMAAADQSTANHLRGLLGMPMRDYTLAPDA